jgi:tetratricopeptide (TPR) repeat protein
MQLTNYNEAVADFSRVLESDTNNSSALFNRALAYLLNDKLDAARVDYQKLQNSYTNAYQVAYGLGEIAWRRRETNEVIRNYRIYLANANTNTDEARTVFKRLGELKAPGGK